MSANRFEDVRRCRIIGEALTLLDDTTYLFRQALLLGYPKFTDATEIHGRPMTAFVALDHKDTVVFAWGRQFFDYLLDDDAWAAKFPGSTRNERIAFVHVHECLHIVLDHVRRSRGKVSTVWNVAADIVVNYLCETKYKLRPLPGSCVKEAYPPEWGIDPATQSTDDIYAILLQHAKVIASFGPATGHHDSWEELDEKTKEILGEKFREAVAEAAEKDKAAGRDPGGADPEEGDGSGGKGKNKGRGKGKANGPQGGQGALGELREYVDPDWVPVVPWDRLLLNFVGNCYAPSRRAERWDRLPVRMNSLFGRVVLPSAGQAHKRDGYDALLAIDASGSMSLEDIARMRKVAESLPPRVRQKRCSFDSDCYPIESWDDIHGGGGTEIDKVNEYAEELGVSVVICFTDGGFFRKVEVDRPGNWIFVVDGTDAYLPKESKVYLVGEDG